MQVFPTFTSLRSFIQLTVRSNASPKSAIFKTYIRRETEEWILSKPLNNAYHIIIKYHIFWFDIPVNDALQVDNRCNAQGCK